MKEHWESYLKSKLRQEREFLTCAEARMELKKAIKKGGRAYASFSVDEHSSEDMKEMHAIRFGGNIHQSTADNGTYNALKTVVG